MLPLCKRGISVWAGWIELPKTQEESLSIVDGHEVFFLSKQFLRFDPNDILFLSKVLYQG